MKQPERILYCMPETFGDCLISTGVIDSIKKRWPDSKIYVATQEQYFTVFEDNSDIAGTIPYDDTMLNYRSYEKWGPQPENLFDIVYVPFIRTQRIPSWIHGGWGPWLGQVYANECDVSYGEMKLKRKMPTFELPNKYITVQGQTRQDPKDYDHLDEVLEKISGYTILQVGGPNDKEVKHDQDLRGKTSIHELAYIIENAVMHIGGDSLPMHVAGMTGTDAVIMFGGTYPQQGMAPFYSPHVRCVETQDRGPCGTSCHLEKCTAKDMGYDKCINNIPLERVLEEVRDILGSDNVDGLEAITISAYTIIKDGIKHGFPFKEAIAAACKVADQVSVVDGGSTDGTLEKLEEFTSGDGLILECGFQINPHDRRKIRVKQHKWDMDNPTLFGDEKTYARQLCTGTHLVQFDCDELISEPEPGMIRKLVEKHRFDDVVDLPCINFYGDVNTIRIEPQFWKWRISKNDFNIVHGVHGDARTMDPKTGRITMDKRISDACEYIYEDTLKVVNHKRGFNPEMMNFHELLKRGEISKEEYLKRLEELIGNTPVIFHYSWLDLDRKAKNGEFWDQTWHGKKNATHNTTENITKRIEHREKELLLKVEFDHPLKQMQGALQ